MCMDLNNRMEKGVMPFIRKPLQDWRPVQLPLRKQIGSYYPSHRAYHAS